MNINKHISDILQLYEFSMAIGKTLDYYQNCDNFLTLLLARKNLSGCCILKRESASYLKMYSYPDHLMEHRAILLNPFLEACYEQEHVKIGVFTKEEEKEVCFGEKKGSWAFFHLKNDQSLLLFNQKGKPFDQVEVNQLSPIIEKFSISLQACQSFSEQQHLLAKLTTQNQELREYSQVISHDLKSPLRNIFALIAWIKEDFDKIDPEIIGHLNGIEKNVEKMDNLIKGLYTYATIDKFEHRNKEIHVHSALTEIFRTIDIPKHIEVHINSNLTVLSMNLDHFNQLFTHLIQNSVQSIETEKGYIRIDIQQEGEQLECFVTDTGKGIDQKYSQKVFEVFESIDGPEGAIGIGLPIAKKIVEYYKGNIWFESKKNEGTTFYFTLKI